MSWLRGSQSVRVAISDYAAVRGLMLLALFAVEAPIKFRGESVQTAGEVDVRPDLLQKKFNLCPITVINVATFELQ